MHVPSRRQFAVHRSGAIALVLLVAACGGTTGAPSQAPATTTPAPSPTGTPVPTATATGTASPTSAATSAPRPVIGAPIAIGDQQVLTIVAAEEWPGEGQQTPGPSTILVTLSVTLRAVTATSVDPANFPLVDGFGKQYLPQPTGRTPQLTGTPVLAAGKTASGYLTYVVGREVGMADLQLEYHPGFVSTTIVVRLLQ